MQQLFQQLKVLYWALMAGQVLFAAVVYYLITSNSMEHEPSGAVLYRILVPMIIMGAAAAAYFLNRHRMTQVDELKDLNAKAQHYRFLVILRSAIMEGANLFVIIVAMLEMNLIYLMYFAVGLAVFIYFRPSIEEFCHAYGVNKKGIDA